MKALALRLVVAAPVALVALTLAACGGGGGGSSGSGAGGTGTVNVHMTDAPYPLDAISQAQVTVTEVSLQGSGSGGFVNVFAGSKTIDLLALRNGATDLLSSAQVPAGSYNQVRFVISSAHVALTDGRSFDLTVPSGFSSGLKVFISPALEVASGISEDLLLDVDLASSFEAVPSTAVVATDITSFKLHPVVRVSNLSTVGRIAGRVFNGQTTVDTADDVPLANATVRVKQGGSVVGTAISGADGRYAVLGLAPGSYDVEAEQLGFAPVSVTSQGVVAGSVTTVDLRLAPN